MRELEFDGHWTGDAVYTCEQCGEEERFRFDDEDVDSKAHRAYLRNEKGWITTKVNGQWADFCSEKCRNAYIRNQTL